MIFAQRDPQSPNELPDSELVRLLREGHPDPALGILFDRYHQRVNYAAYAIMGDREDAKDITQDAFLRLYRYAHRVDPDRLLMPWLYRVTVNLARTELNRRYRRRLIPMDDLLDTLISPPGESPEAIFNRREQAAHIVDALRQLSDKHMSAIILCHVDNLSIEQIADIERCPVGTIKTRLHHARKLLKVRLSHLRARDDLSEVLDEEWITDMLRSAFP